MDTLTFYLACWGAVVATATLAWDVTKWLREGPALVFEVCPFFITEDDDDDRSEVWAPKLDVTITNRGDRSCSLSGVALDFYAKRWHKWMGYSPAYSYIDGMLGTKEGGPVVLDVGRELHFAAGTWAIRKWGAPAALYVSLMHSHGRPLTRFVGLMMKDPFDHDLEVALVDAAEREYLERERGRRATHSSS